MNGWRHFSVYITEYYTTRKYMSHAVPHYMFGTIWYCVKWSKSEALRDISDYFTELWNTVRQIKRMDSTVETLCHVI